jgi:hypothetical protein
MNVTRSFLCVAFLLPVSFLSAKEPDALFYVKPQAVARAAFVQKLTSLPEWETFRTQACNTIDEVANTGLTDRKQLEERLPKNIADRIASKVETRGGFSVYEMVTALRKHLEAVVVMAEDMGSQGFVGTVALIGDIDPSQGLIWLDILGGVKEGQDYKFLKKEPGGDFILQASRTVQGRHVEICCAGLKLPGDSRYALLFSNDAGIQKSYDAFKKGTTDAELTKGYVQKLVVGDRGFRAIEKIGQRNTWSARMMDVCGQVNGVEFGSRDLGGSTQIEAKLSLKKADDAKTVRDLILGVGMFVQLAATAKEETSAETKDLARQAANFLQTIKAEAKGTDVVITLTLDGDDLWNIISGGLKAANNELKQKKDFASLRSIDWQSWFQRHIMSIVQ